MAVTHNNILRASPNLSTKMYVNELGKGSTSLSHVNEQFRNICGDLALVSFNKTLKTSIGPTKIMACRMRIKIKIRSANKLQVVDKESAVLGYPGEISAPLHADHHGLTKFKNKEDGNYRDVRNVLRTFLNISGI